MCVLTGGLNYVMAIIADRSDLFRESSPRPPSMHQLNCYSENNLINKIKYYPERREPGLLLHRESCLSSCEAGEMAEEERVLPYLK